MCELNENEEINKKECNETNNIQNSHKRSNSINYSKRFSKTNNNNNQNPSTINFIINNFQNIMPPQQKQFFPQNQMFQTPNLMFQSQSQFFPFQQDMNFQINKIYLLIHNFYLFNSRCIILINNFFPFRNLYITHNK